MNKFCFSMTKKGRKKNASKRWVRGYEVAGRRILFKASGMLSDIGHPAHVIKPARVAAKKVFFKNAIKI